MNKKYPTFFLTWFNKFPRVPSPGTFLMIFGAHIYEHLKRYESEIPVLIKWS